MFVNWQDQIRFYHETTEKLLYIFLLSFCSESEQERGI